MLGLAIDPGSLRPVLGAVTGGLSGPAIKPVALRCVWQVHAAFPDVPIFGIGGVRTGTDALEFLLAGASAVQVGTALFGDPTALPRIIGELGTALEERGFDPSGRGRRAGAPLAAFRRPGRAGSAGGCVPACRGLTAPIG